MTTAALGAPRRRRSLRSFAASPVGWTVLAVIVAIALVTGSIRPSAPSASARIAYLESVIKCPSCDNLSIAQSSSGVAQALRNEVRTLVEAGWSTPRIETRIEAEYGTAEVLSPPGGLVWVIPIIAVGLGAVAIAVVLARSRRRRRASPSDDDELVVRRALDGLGEGA